MSEAMTIDGEALKAALGCVARHVEAAKAELCEADGALGDGDLGITVARGFAEAAAADLPGDVGLAFLEISKAFQRVSSSSYGTLVATAFMSAAKACKGRTGIAGSEIAELVAGARDAMMARGKGALGDKTVLDSLDAAARALEGADGPAMLEAAVAAASRTVDQFRDKPNRLGRARMFGERSIGLADPGQLAFLRIVEGLRDRSN